MTPIIIKIGDKELLFKNVEALREFIKELVKEKKKLEKLRGENECR